MKTKNIKHEGREGKKLFAEGRATMRVWSNGDFEIKLENAVLVSGNVEEEGVGSEWAEEKLAELKEHSFDYILKCDSCGNEEKSDKLQKECRDCGDRMEVA